MVSPSKAIVVETPSMGMCVGSRTRAEIGSPHVAASSGLSRLSVFNQGQRVLAALPLSSAAGSARQGSILRRTRIVQMVGIQSMEMFAATATVVEIGLSHMVAVSGSKRLSPCTTMETLAVFPRTRAIRFALQVSLWRHTMVAKVILSMVTFAENLT